MALAISVAGYIAFGPSPVWLSDRNASLFAPDCGQIENAGRDDTTACVTATVLDDTAKDVDSAAPADNTGRVLSNSHRQARQFLHIGKVGRLRAGLTDPSLLSNLQSGITVSELCMSIDANNELRCRTKNDAATLGASDAQSGSDFPSKNKIAGHVLTTDGSGLSGVTIVAAPARLSDRQSPKPERMRFWTVTDVLGAYSLDGLPEGEYQIRSGQTGSYQSARISARTGVGYADLVVSRNMTTVVEGQVLTSAAEPLEGVTVLPYLLGQPSVLTEVDGRFSLPITVKPTTESISLRFQRPGFSEQSDKVDVRPHTASSNKTLNVVMHPVESWTSVTGNVFSDSGKPLASVSVELRPLTARKSFKTTTDSQGAIHISVCRIPCSLPAARDSRGRLHGLSTTGPRYHGHWRT